MLPDNAGANGQTPTEGLDFLLLLNLDWEEEFIVSVYEMGAGSRLGTGSMPRVSALQSLA